MNTKISTRKTGKRDAVNLTLREALRYAAMGWRILPLHNPTPDGCSCCNNKCQSIGKHPRTARGLKEGSAEQSNIRAWWKRWPNANVGIVTGPESGLCVLDVDGMSGQESLRSLEALGTLPRTPRVLTGRKSPNGERTGYHLYFKHTTEAAVRNSAGRLGKGLDIRAAGGYVVAPPSRHASGLQYEWEGDASAVAELPAWLVARASKSALEVGHGSDEKIPEGRRNSTLLSQAYLTASIGRCVRAQSESSGLRSNRR